MAEKTYRERITTVEFLVTMAILLPVGLIALEVLSQSTTARAQRVCQYNLKQIGQALDMYMQESPDHRYPLPKLYDCEGSIQPWSGSLDLAGVHPEYVKDLNLLVCPAYPTGKTAIEIWDEGKTTNPRWEAVDGFSNNGTVEPCEVLAKPYYYYGWAFAEGLFQAATTYSTLEPEDPEPAVMRYRGLPSVIEYDWQTHNNRFAIAVSTLAEKLRRGAFDPTSNEWEMTYPNGKRIELPSRSKILALADGVERFYVDEINDIAAFGRKRGTIVVLHEEVLESAQAFYHGTGGLNVLYLDGHVEHVRHREPQYGDRFPLNKAGLILHDAVEGTLSVP